MTSISLPQSPSDSREVMRSIDEKGNIEFGQVKLSEIDFAARFGAKVTSSSLNSIAVGTQIYTTDQDAAKFKVGDDVQITCLDDPDCYQYGTIVGNDTTYSPSRLTIVVNDVSLLVCDSKNWEIQVVARPKAWLEVDVSTTGIDPTSAGPFTMAVTAGKLFNFPGGTILLRSITKPGVAVLCRLFNYNSTSLILTKIGTTATVSETLSSWDVALIDANPSGIPFLQRNGLNVSVSGTTLTVTKGSIRDSTKFYDLDLPSTFTKDLSATWAKGTGNGGSIFSANLSGTAAAATNTLTGSSSTFLTDFSNASNVVFPDFTARGGSIVTSPTATAIKIAGAAQAVANVTTNTAGSIAPAMTVSATTYKRGGYYTGLVTGVVGNLVINYGVLLIREDATGDTDIGIYSLYSGSAPDLPSGWSVYGALADLQVTYVAGVFATVYVTQWSGTALSQISPMTTDGDMINQVSGVPARFAKGADGTLLTIAAGTQAWASALPNGTTATTQSAGDNSTKAATTAYVATAVAAVPAAGLVLLNTLTASSSSTLDDTTSITSTYDNYMIVLTDIILSTTGLDLNMRISEDAGASYKTTTYLNTSSYGVTTAGAIVVSAVTAGMSILDHLLAGNSNTTTNICESILYFQNPNSAARKRLIGVTNAASTQHVFGQYTTDTNAINAIRFLPSSGTITSGTIKIYGVKK